MPLDRERDPDLGVTPISDPPNANDLFSAQHDIALFTPAVAGLAADPNLATPTPIIMLLRFSSSTVMADPGSGSFRLNNGQQNRSTIIVISQEDLNGIPTIDSLAMSNLGATDQFLDTLMLPYNVNTSRIQMARPGLQQAPIEFNVLQRVVVPGTPGYQQLTISILSGGMTFTDGDIAIISVKSPIPYPAWAPRGWVAEATWVTGTTSVIITPADVTNATVTWTAIPTRRYKHTIRMHALSTTANDALSITMTDAAGALKGAPNSSLITVPGASLPVPYEAHSTESGLTGTIVRKLRVARIAGAGTVQAYADSTYGASWVVEDIGSL